jgi:hypothetical protein
MRGDWVALADLKDFLRERLFLIAIDQDRQTAAKLLTERDLSCEINRQQPASRPRKMAGRRPHNPKVAGSNPVPATNFKSIS